MTPRVLVDAAPPELAAALEADDVVVCERWAEPSLVKALRATALERYSEDGFRRARVGRGDGAVIDDRERGDEVLWLEPDTSPAVAALFEHYEALREAVNASTFAGLFDWEGHFAVYPPGRGYRRHLDRFRDDDRRTLSTVLYLNANWHPDHGGALELWSPDAPAEAPPDATVAPKAGTLALFWSDRIPHAVATSHTPRWSIAGWFRRR